MLEYHATSDRQSASARLHAQMGRLPGPIALLTAALVVLAGLAAPPAMAETLRGTALIRERIAIPPDAVFEAVIEDTSRADAPSRVLARKAIEPAGQPPIDFAIDYDPEALEPGAIYTLRATIRREGQLLFTTDTVTRVLGDDTPANVEVILSMIPDRRTGTPSPSIGAHGLSLPASFRGTLPCADCEGIRHHLDLWPAQYYHLRREWLGRTDGTAGRDEIGRWYADPARGAIVLFGAAEMPLFWEVKGPDRLRQMDMAGNPVDSDLPYELASDGTLDPTELSGMLLLGMMTYIADAALFEECLSGVRYPIAQEGDYLALERAYLDAQTGPGAPLLVHVTGGLAPRAAMEGPDRMSLVVENFNRVIPEENCAQHRSAASLTNTYWRIDSLRGETIGPVDGSREPHLVLLGAPETRFRATVGCNQIIGGYESDGDELTFGTGASTMMACPPPLDRMERQLRDALAVTRSFRLVGQTLQLQDADGNAIAELAAVYLR